MRDRLTTVAAYVIGLALIIGIPTGIWVFQSSMEARAYERVTGKKVSTWDAMWVELRVQGAPE